jgi:O-antigen/teichoic acid export membrane protein
VTSTDGEEERRAASSRFTTLIGFNGVAQVAPILVALATTPVLVHRLGADRFGIWSLALIALSTLTSLDGGVSASLARFFAIYAARSERSDTGRLLLGAFVLFVVLGVVMTAAAFALAPALVPLLHIPKQLESEAIWAFRWLPGLAVLGLASDAVAALLQGNGQFRGLAGATTISAVAFLVAVLVLVHGRSTLEPVFVAMALRYAAMAVFGLLLARGRLSLGRPRLPSRATVREVGSYASRMQLAALSGFVNAELDGFVIAAVSPVRYVGLYGIGLQAASAARSVPLYAFSPLLTRLTTTFRRDGRDAAAEEFALLEQRWLPSVLGFGVVAVAAVAFSVPIWLGHGYGLSGATAAILLSGFVVHVGYTGLRTCYVRAIGRPGLEARYSTAWTVCNAILTVPLALVAGMLGVVGATAATGMLASAYFVRLCKRAESLPVVSPGARWCVAALVAVAATVAGEVFVLHTGVEGYVGLVLTGIPAGVGVVGMLAFVRYEARGGG